MRIYQPKNELGQPLLNEGQLVATSKSVSLPLENGAITLANDTVEGITNITDWDVKNVEVTIAGQTMAFSAGVEKTAAGLVIHFADAVDAGRLEFTEAKLTLQLVDSQGFTLGGGNESTLTLEVKLTNAINSGELANIDAVVDEIIATGDKERIQAAGATLGEYAKGLGEDSGVFANDEVYNIYKKYKYAGYKNAEDFVNADEGSDDDGYFRIGESCMLSLESNADYNGYSMNIRQCESYTYDLPLLENGEWLSETNTVLKSFSAKLPSLTIGRGMFRNCYNLSSFTSDLPKLTDGYHMFQDCQLDQSSVDHILATIKDWSGDDEEHILTLGVADGVDVRDREFAAKGWTIDLGF